jgi:hypothetical protein
MNKQNIVPTGGIFIFITIEEAPVMGIGVSLAL